MTTVNDADRCRWIVLADSRPALRAQQPEDARNDCADDLVAMGEGPPA